MMSTRSPSSVGSARGPDFMQSMERADKRHKKLLTVRERNVLHSNPLPLCLRATCRNPVLKREQLEGREAAQGTCAS